MPSSSVSGPVRTLFEVGIVESLDDGAGVGEGPDLAGRREPRSR